MRRSDRLPKPHKLSLNQTPNPPLKRNVTANRINTLSQKLRHPRPTRTIRTSTPPLHTAMVPTGTNCNHKVPEEGSGPLTTFVREGTYISAHARAVEGWHGGRRRGQAQSGFSSL